MIFWEFRPPLPGKQSDEDSDTSRLSNVPSELPYLGSKQLLLASSDVRYLGAALTPGPLPANS